MQLRTRTMGAIIMIVVALVAAMLASSNVGADQESWQVAIGTPPAESESGEEQAERQVVGGQVIASPSWMVSGFCGGTLIAPQWVISAHHCGNRAGFQYTIGGVETRTVAQYFPIVGGEFDYNAPDLALWKLDTPSSQQPIAFSRDVGLDDPGDWVFGIGYGNLGANIPSDGQLRSTGWRQVDRESYYWAFEYGDPGVTTCFGDSGGPVIGDANPPNASLILVGVTSYTVPSQGQNCVELAGAAKVADNVGWIDSVINSNGGPGIYVPAQATPTPVPGQDTPVVNAVGNQQSPTFAPVSLQVTGFHPQGQPLTWSADNLPPGLTMDSSTGLVSGTPATEGSYDVLVRATYGCCAGLAQFTWEITPGVAPTPEPPVITSGDVNCSDEMTIADALIIAQYAAGNRTDSGGCPLGDAATSINVAGGDLNDDGATSIVDALIIARCLSGVESDLCPA